MSARRAGGRGRLLPVVAVWVAWVASGCTPPPAPQLPTEIAHPATIGSWRVTRLREGPIAGAGKTVGYREAATSANWFAAIRSEYVTGSDIYLGRKLTVWSNEPSGNLRLAASFSLPDRPVISLSMSDDLIVVAVSGDDQLRFHVFSRVASKWSSRGVDSVPSIPVGTGQGVSVLGAEVSGSLLALVEIGVGALPVVEVLRIDPTGPDLVSPEAQLSPSPSFPADTNVFGASIDVSGDRIAVGAPGKDTSSNGAPGRVELYRRAGSDWSWETSVSDPDGSPSLGEEVALDADPVPRLAAPIRTDPTPHGPDAIDFFVQSGASWTFDERLDHASAGSLQGDVGRELDLDDDVFAIADARVTEPPSDAHPRGYSTLTAIAWHREGDQWADPFSVDLSSPSPDPVATTRRDIISLHVQGGHLALGTVRYEDPDCTPTSCPQGRVFDASAFSVSHI